MRVHYRDFDEQGDGGFHQLLVKGKDNEDLLYVHLDHRLPYQRRSEEGPERDQEVAAGDARQVKQLKT